jgi:hypothetical protein
MIYMAARAEIPGMWVRPTPIPHGGGHRLGYGEAHSTRNSRFLELADVILSASAPAEQRVAAAASRESLFHAMIALGNRARSR